MRHILEGGGVGGRWKGAPSGGEKVPLNSPNSIPQKGRSSVESFLAFRISAGWDFGEHLVQHLILQVGKLRSGQRSDLLFRVEVRSQIWDRPGSMLYDEGDPRLCEQMG